MEAEAVLSGDLRIVSDAGSVPENVNGAAYPAGIEGRPASALEDDEPLADQLVEVLARVASDRCLIAAVGAGELAGQLLQAALPLLE